jgi:hypothetical protein
VIERPDEPRPEPDEPTEPSDPDATDLDTTGEPEPDWAEGIRRGRRERAERLRRLLGDDRGNPDVLEVPGGEGPEP